MNFQEGHMNIFLTVKVIYTLIFLMMNIIWFLLHENYFLINFHNNSNKLVFILGDHSMKQVLSSFSRGTPCYKGQPKVSCVTVFDSDSDDHLSPLKNSSGCKTKVIKPEPQKDVR